jgi:hypothetical protein
LVFAAIATSRKRSGFLPRTSSVLSPTEPVEPSTATPIILPPQGKSVRGTIPERRR